MIRFRLLVRCALCAVFAAGTAFGADDALVRALPTPDMAKLPKDTARQLSQARADFEKARVGLIGNDLALAYAEIGALYFRAGLDDAAAVAFYDASQLAPKDARWLYLRGVVAQAMKRGADARADFEAALALDKVYLPIRYRLSDTLIGLGDLDAAHKVLADALPAGDGHAALFAMLGRLELHQKDYGAAIEHLQQALKLEPQANALYADLAAAFAGHGDAAQATAARAKAGTTPPNLADPLVAGIFGAAATPAPALHGSALEQARQLLARRDFVTARDKAADAANANPKDVEAFALLARLDGLLGNGAFAREEATQALELDPANASANLSQGMVDEFAGGAAKALPYYQRAVASDPDQPDARLLLGNALMRAGNYAQAAVQYRQLVRILDGNASAEARLAAALAMAGQCRDALDEVNARLSKRAQDGDLMQVFVRLASTCPAASADERGMALDYAKALYKQRPDAGDSTALALAQAANGKFDDAQKAQAEAIFEAVRLRDTARADMYRRTMRDFVAKRRPAQPWPAEHPYVKPPPLAALVPPPSSP
ncbi:MAG: tetratricopeptide repeat protein [Proteobacteria bacterium]|nr:tetratricopeptide repeat protein [Pseudomonadota bacterium]